MRKNNNRPKIAIIARTSGLEYDDRIRKECIALYKNMSLKTFIANCKPYRFT